MEPIKELIYARERERERERGGGERFRNNLHKRENWNVPMRDANEKIADSGTNPIRSNIVSKTDYSEILLSNWPF